MKDVNAFVTAGVQKRSKPSFAFVDQLLDAGEKPPIELGQIVPRPAPTRGASRPDATPRRSRRESGS